MAMHASDPYSEEAVVVIIIIIGSPIEDTRLPREHISQHPD